MHVQWVVELIFLPLSNLRPSHVSIDPSTLLPDTADVNHIKEEFQVLVSRLKFWSMCIACVVCVLHVCV